MDEQLLYLREEHGDVFVTRLPSGQTIPWKPLTINEYLKYQTMFRMGQYPQAYIEDEIFRKCVVDRAFVLNMKKQKAGIVSTVVATIMAHSGPQSAEEINIRLNMSRARTEEIVHSIVEFICQAFPAYKPEDVYEMDYQTLIFRAAQAERKMITAGFIQEPLSFYSKEDSEVEQQKQVEKTKERRTENQDMINKYYEQQGISVPESVKQARKAAREHIVDYPKPPPVPETKLGEHTVITKSDMMEHEAVLTGHEQDIVHKIKATDETAQLYTDYLDQVKEGNKLRIKTPEERKAAAEIRMEANKQELIKRREKALEEAKKELPKLLKVRKEARRRKEKKAARRRR